jgi:arylsulfatase A-like enzyme
MRFNNFFAGSSVCAPTRCCFLTGKHSGHTSVRSNGGGTALRAEEETIASMVKQVGYATGGYGKWGCGGRDSTGVPEVHGFDEFLGYYDQVHAHTYYPPYLIRNSEEVPLAGNKGGSDGKTYSHYVIHAAALKFIRENAKKPFFAYLPYTPPHGIFDIPDDDPAWALYKDKDWPEQARRYAAMVAMIDRQVGEVLALLKELGIDKSTLVFFSGDNGGADYFKTKEFPRGIHSANKHPVTGVEYRGAKGNLYEGGLRIPFVAYWPGKIEPGRASDYLGYFPDIMATIADVTGAKPPADIDGLSVLPELIGQKAAGHAQQQHAYLYWEFSGWFALRQGDWRIVKAPKGAWELYDLSTDPSEAKELSKTKPDILAKLVALAEKAHEPAVEGTFSRTDRHERDRRTKFGKQDDTSLEASPGRVTKIRAKHTSAATVSLIQGALPNKDWKVVRFSSENVANQKYARNAIDGDPSTLWHTQFTGTVVPPPHELVVYLGAERTIRGFVYLGRQDEGWNGAVKEIEFSVGPSADTFGDPVAKATLMKSKEAQTMTCPPTKGRFVLLRALSSYSEKKFASVAELGVIGD